MAERGGFEPPVPQRGTAVFETAPIGRSGTSPPSDIPTFAPDVQSLGNAIQAIDNVFASVPKVKVNAPIAP